MKKIIALVLVLVMCLSLTACKSKEAKKVESLIEAIGEVTLDSETAVISAENAYNALTDEDKAEIENYEILITARSTLDSLIDAVLNEKYNHGLSLMDNGDYQSAYTVFEELGDYKDSIEKLEEASNGIQYLEALKLIEQGAYLEARSIFYEISDFKDVPEYLARYETVEITPENWDTYFEIREVPLYIDDAFGEVREIYLAYCVVLREEYVSKLCVEEDMSIIFEFEYDYRPVDLQVDKVAHTYAYTEIMGNLNTETRTATYNVNALTSEATFADYDSANEVSRENAFATYSVQPFTENNEVVWRSGQIIENLVATRTNGTITIFN